MSKPKSAYEVTMLLHGDVSARLDALAERGMALRREMGMRGHVGLRDVLAQAVEVGLVVMERSVEKGETQSRLVLTPKEWASKLGASGPGGLVVAR